MNVLDTCSIQCPYCGEIQTLLVDRSQESQSYVEDCEACCQPILLNILRGADGYMSIIPHQENE